MFSLKGGAGHRTVFQLLLAIVTDSLHVVSSHNSLITGLGPSFILSRLVSVWHNNTLSHKAMLDWSLCAASPMAGQRPSSKTHMQGLTNQLRALRQLLVEPQQLHVRPQHLDVCRSI